MVWAIINPNGVLCIKQCKGSIDSQYYQEKISKNFFENVPEEFERLKEDDHGIDYAYFQ